MKNFLCVILTLFATSVMAQSTDPGALKQQAEAFFAEKSYSKAYDLYNKIDRSKLSQTDARWVTFRLADTLWRSQVSTETPDSTKVEQARDQLVALVRDIKIPEDQDNVYAEVEESLGDFSWARQNTQNWSEAAPHYQNAMNWWAGQSNNELARTRYIQLVFRAVAPPWMEIRYGSYYGNNLPLEILDNAVKLSRGPAEESRSHYLLANQLRMMGDWDQRRRVPQEYEASLRSGKTSDWHDDALFGYAQWMESTGDITQSDTGEWRQQADYVKALELYRQIISEYRKGETKYYDQATQQINELTRTVVGVQAPNIFLPNSEIQLGISWRNTKRVEIAVYPVDLTRDVKFPNRDNSAGTWINEVSLTNVKPTKTWTKETNDDGRHVPGSDLWKMDQHLPSGAWIVEVRSGSAKARDIILVTESSLVVKTSGSQALLYFCNALTGAPMAAATVSLWEHYYINNEQHWAWKQTAKTTDKDGIANFTIDEQNNNSRELFAAATLGNSQAFSLGNSYYAGRNSEPWRIYAYTDRPAYRPNETVQWKFVARRMIDSTYSTPANSIVEYEIDDPRGNKVKEDKTTLNAFGSAWSKVDLTETMPLGEYRVTFYEPGRSRTIGNATLFRLEEYKLPEYKVTVQTPEVNGQKKAFRLGEKVEAKIKAEYYFGGAVSDASVEVLVYQKPYYHYWYAPREYGWYYDDMDGRQNYYNYGNGSIIKRETLKTDAAGMATLEFETPRDGGQDLEYVVEARVTDSSRREITGTDSVRVSRQRYFVYSTPSHYLYKPNDKVQVDFKSLDANNQPVSVGGQVTVTRNRYIESWVDPTGREVTPEELQRIRNEYAIRGVSFPPPPDASGHGWQLRFQGYKSEPVLTQSVKTDAQGSGILTFPASKEGYYQIAWTSPDIGAPAVQSNAEVWVSTGKATETGYRHGGVQLILDKDTARVGESAPVLITSETPDRWVLLTIDGDGLYDYQLVHLTGTSKMIEIPIQDKHVPNIYLGAVMISNHQIYIDSKQLIVPPADHFLNMSVKADKPQYEPGEEGTLEITTRDNKGRPVPAEVSLGLIDSSVFYIQKDQAADPRQYFFGTKRPQVSQVQSTLQQKSYVRLVRDSNENLVDEETVKYKSLGKDDRSDVAANRSTFGVGGQIRSGDSLAINGRREMMMMDGASAKSAPASPVAAESISVASDSAIVSGNGQPEPAVKVRSDFRSTAFWQPDVVTNENGTATVKVKYPESLTSWTATARAVTSADSFGVAASETRTKQPIIVRLQSPRFFVVGDTATVSAVINNNNDHPVSVTPSLEAEGLKVTSTGQNSALNHAAAVSIPAEGETRVDWTVAVTKPGDVKIKVTANGGSQSDAMEKSFVAYEHGIEKLVAKSGKLRGSEAVVSLDVPAARKPETTSVDISVTPSMAVTMLDALPYLIDYPYGCTEQTMSRFLPAAITAKTLSDLKISPDVAMSRVFGGVEQGTAAQTHPDGKRSLKELQKIEKDSLERLYSMQHDDGGWGWWKEDSTDHFMTAYVVWGMTLASDAGVEVRQDVLGRAVAYLNVELVKEEDSYDMQAWMLHAVATHGALVSRKTLGDYAVSEFQQKAFNNLWDNREKLNAYTRALVALSAHYFGYKDKAEVLVRNLENGVKIDQSPDVSVVQRGTHQTSDTVIGTAHWGADGIFYRWSDGGIEATSFVLRALLTIDPSNKLIEPVTNWLVKNRRGAQWNNTRDTAITVLALNDYLRVTGEAVPEMDYEVLVNGTSVAQRHLTAADAFTAPATIHVDNAIVRNGQNEVRIVRRSGTGPLYFSAKADFFSLEEPIKSSGNEIFVRREYFKFVGRQTLLKGLVYDRLPLKDGDTVNSGDRIDVVVTVESKNNYEYLLFEDLKPAGFEAVQVQSGTPFYARQLKSSAVDRKFNTASANPDDKDVAVRKAAFNSSEADARYTGEQSFVYQELRDRKVAMFIDKLQQGIWEMRYTLRAETPGTFHALPMMGQAMYVPEIKCNDDEQIIRIVDAK